MTKVLIEENVGQSSFGSLYSSSGKCMDQSRGKERGRGGGGEELK